MRSERPDVARTPFVVAGGRYAIGSCICIMDMCVCRVEACRRGCAGARRSVRPRRVRIVSLIDMHMVRRPLLRCVQHVETPPTPTARTDGGDRRGERRPRARRPRQSGTRRSAAHRQSTRRQRRGARDRSPYLLRHRPSRAPPAQRACATRYPRSTRGGSRAFMRLATRGALASLASVPHPVKTSPRHLTVLPILCSHPLTQEGPCRHR